MTTATEDQDPKIVEAGTRFIRWLQEAVASGELNYNERDSMVHFVEEGMMLVSPAIFIHFSKLNGEDGLGSPSNGSPGVEIQRNLLKCGWHMRVLNSRGLPNNIATYSVKSPGKSTTVKAVVIKSPERYFSPVPDRNPYLKLKSTNPNAKV